jgi:hypothetical protein
MTRRLSALAVLVAATIGLGITTAGAAPAGHAHPRVGPNQAFVGLVNGSTGQPTHAVIRVACPGPASGTTTHPLPDQTLAVSLPAAVAPTVGRTGPDAKHISAFMGIPPAAASSTDGIATFTHYGRTKPIPTTLNVPCSGSGYITFIPFPRVPGETQAFVVPVDYDNIAG